MPWIAAGGSLLGGLLGGRSQERAARSSAAAQLEAARIAAEEARFRPIGITTRFGQSMFNYGIPGTSAPTIDQFKTREQQLAEAQQNYSRQSLMGANYGAAGRPPTLDQFRTPEEQLAAATADYQTRLQSEGRLTGAGYSLSPEMIAYQNRIQALADQRLSEAESASEIYSPLRSAGQSLFDLGQQYLAESPEEVASKYMAQQMNLLAPGRERTYAQLQNNLFQTGRTGLAVGATGARPDGTAGLAAANPEMEAYYNALAQQDAQLTAQAQQAGQQQLAFGTSLYGLGADLLGGYESGVTGAMNPFMTALGGVSTLESLGQQSLDIGAQLGGRSATAGANVGQTLFQGGTNAALTRQNAQYDPLAAILSGFGSNPQFGQNLANMFSGYGNASNYDWGAGNVNNASSSYWR